MGWRGTAALALALLAAGVYLYLDVTAEQPGARWEAILQGPSATPPGDQIKRLLAFDPRDIVAIHLRHGDVDARVQRTGNGWAGVQRPEVLNDFLDGLRDLAEILPLDVGPQGLADHGLDPPQGEIELERAAGPPIVLRLGHRNPPATGVYVQVGEGGPVVLTGALVLWEFEKALKSVGRS